MAEHRPAVTPSGWSGLEAEIFLYDTLPGGAGYAQAAAALGRELFVEARRILADCPEACDVSCYRCLRNFRNRLDHGLLDRHVGVALVDYLLSGNLASFDLQRLTNATNQLVTDLERQIPGETAVEKIAMTQDDGGQRYTPAIQVTRESGERMLVCVDHPLCEPPPPQEVLVSGKSTLVVRVSELFVRRSLADATLQAIRELRLDAP